MNLEYDITTRHIKIQIKEETYRAVEKQAELEHKTVSRVSRRIFEDAVEPLLATLTDEDLLIINQRIDKNLRSRMEAREKK